MVKYSYYALTTLSTVGFGDYGPKSVYEKQLMTGVLLFGVTIFALVMNNLMTVLKNYKQIGLVEGSGRTDLQKWLTLISKLNNGRPLKK